MTTHQYNRFCQMFRRGTEDLYYLKANSDPNKIDSWEKVIYEDIQSVFVNTPAFTALSLDFFRYKDELPKAPETVPFGPQDIEIHTMSFQSVKIGAIYSVATIMSSGVWFGYPKKLFIDYHTLMKDYLYTTCPKPADPKAIWLPCSKQK